MKLIYILFFILGSIIGSFLNATAMRLSTGSSIIYPRSHCDKCQKKLNWYELIPILSYIFLKGRCSKCQQKIPVSNIIIEICCGILYTVCYHKFKLTYELIIALIFVSSIITIIVSDIEFMIILDEVLLFSVFSILIVDLINIGVYETSLKIISGLLSFIIMLIIKKIGDTIFKQESLGGGDIKLMFLIGLVIGLEMAICNIFLATFIAFPVALLLLLMKRENMIPFGPFLSMAALIIYISGVNFQDIISVLIK